jgi:uncharacterized protein YcaQ
MLTISPTTARRLALTKQRLAGPSPAKGPEGILDLVRDLGCLQLDPMSVVARSHLLVLQSRLGCYDPADLDTLLWQDRSLFEYWAHAASIVLTEDYPLHSPSMRRFGNSDAPWDKRVRAWMEQNRDLRESVLSQIRERGPLLSKDSEDISDKGWRSSGWTNERNVSRMLDFLWSGGVVMVAGRKGIQKMWDLTERCLPDWTPREELDDHEVSYRAAQKSLRALGVGTARHIQQHFIRGRYRQLPQALKDLEAEGRIQSAHVEGDGKKWPGVWYIHAEDLPLLEQIERGKWEPRTTLISPFDNLIIDRARAELLFDFYFRIEIYVPKAQRQYGYYVLPIVHGDRLIGRIDPAMDRKKKRLVVNAVHAEPDAPTTKEAGRAVAQAIEELAAFLGAREIAYGDQLPEAWRPAMRARIK